MRRLLVWALLSAAALAQSSTNIGGTEGAQQVFNGTLYANAFGSWSVPQGDAGQFTWSNPNICTSLQGLTFRLFVVGLPITIVDANPALTENTTITAVHVLPSQCNIVTAPLTNSHFSFRIVSGTLGVQEAINYAQQNNLATTVHVTQAWTRLGGQTSMITGAQGNANIGILDERNTVALAFYAWNGATYNKIPIGTAAQPILCTFSTPTTNWSCAHNLGTLQVQVEYLNLTSTKIFPDSPGPCPDVNTCNATFLQPQAGYMLISFAGNVGQTQTNPNPVVINPVSSQTITGNQPLNVTGPTTVLNNTLTVTGDNATSLGGSLSAKRPIHFSDCSNSGFANTAACQADAGTTGGMLFPFGYSTGSFTNPNNIPVLDFTRADWRGYLRATDYGLVGDNSTDNTSAFNSLASYACSIGFSTIKFPIGRFLFNSAPNHIGCGLKIEGSGSRGSNDLGGTDLIANYNEASEFNGFLEWDGSYLGFSGCCNGTGGGMAHMQISKNTGKTGGTGIMLTGTGADCSSFRAGHMNFTDVLISSGNQTGTWQHTAVGDGSCASVFGSAGIRDVEWNDVWFNDATVTDQTIYCKTCVHWHFSGGEVYTGSGSASGITVTGLSGSNQFSDDVHFDNLAIFGDLVWDYARNSSYSGHVTAASSTTANTQNVFMSGNFDSAAPVTTACGSACGYVVNVAGNSFMFFSSGFFAGNVLGKGAVGASSTGTQVGGNGQIYSVTGTNTGAAFLGSDGNCFVSRIGTSTVNFNCGNGAIWGVPNTNSTFFANGFRTGQSSNQDSAGRIALTAGSATYTLQGTYASAPNALCYDVTTPANTCSVSESTTVLTFTGTGTDTVKWILVGRN